MKVTVQRVNHENEGSYHWTWERTRVGYSFLVFTWGISVRVTSSGSVCGGVSTIVVGSCGGSCTLVGKSTSGGVILVLTGKEDPTDISTEGVCAWAARSWSMWHFLTRPPSSFTEYETFPCACSKTPEIHFPPEGMSLTQTVDPSLNFLSLDCLSWLFFCWACCFSTLSAVFGLRKSSRVRKRLPSNSSQGAFPVVAWGVNRWDTRVLLSLDRNVPSWFRFSPALTICTARSASPFDAGW